MVKRSKKSKSKRTPLRKKYKILRKVKEHQKKKAKEEKKRGTRARPEKDPGIPNSWPLKEQELAAMEARRQAAVQEKEQQREARRAAREAAREGGAGAAEGDAGADTEAMQRMLGAAGERSQEFERREQGEDEAPSGGTKRKSSEDGSRRAFYREVLKVVEAADVVIEVLDARDPVGCRCPELERLVLRGGVSGGPGGPKRLILLLNKIDLVPREVVEKWLKYLREELPTVAFKCNVQSQKANLGRVRQPKGRPYGGLTSAEAHGEKEGAAGREEDSSSSKCLGAETLIQLLKNYCRNKDIKTSISVGVVGLPNVGKSSLINSLKRARVASVGSTPGVTRALQEVHLDKNVKLLDCPGVVMAASNPEDVAAAALRNAIRIEQLSDPLAPVRRIVQICSKDALMSAYKIARFADVDEFVRAVAFARGRLKKGGIADTTAAAKLILSDWNDGRIPFYTNPPKRESADPGAEAAGAELVQQWGAEFGTEAVFQEERDAVLMDLPMLAQRPEGVFAELPSGAPAQMETDERKGGEGEGEGGEEEEGEQGGEDEEEEEEEEGAEEMDEEMEARGAAPAGEAKKSGKHQQNEALYTADGIQNPHAARAEKRRRKKERRDRSAAEGGPAPKVVAFRADQDDYSFDDFAAA